VVNADIALAAVRALHFASVVILFGQFVYLFTVSPGKQPAPGFHAVAVWCVLAAFASAILWVLLEAPRMSGTPLPQALQADILWTIVTQTQFGHVALLRFVLLSVLAVVLLRSGGFAFGATIAGLLLLTIAASGHASAEAGAPGVVHFVIDSAHLFAAAAWLGALVPLALTLRRGVKGDAATKAAAQQATLRFSSLGIACMAVLLLSGVLNASYTVGLPLSAALRSEYGRLLVLKIVAFIVILVLAGINRTMLMPRIPPSGKDDMDSARAMRWLMRNSLAEILLGFGIVTIVGVLGITAPATHAMAADERGHESHSHESAPAAAYVPGLGEIMTLQQMRHAKLWLAGSARNWELAAYEVDELKEGFESAASLHAVHEGVPVGEMIGKLTPGPLAAVAKAIQDKNPDRFAASFDGLTAACNSCHQAAKHGFIRIGRPNGSPFGNQIFTPAPK
jgi:putative copper resistance protein D